MATQKVRPDPSSLDRQQQREQRRAKNRTIGVFVVAVVVALMVGIGLFAVISLDEPSRVPADRSTGGAAPVADGESDVWLIDVETGEKTPGPDLGPFVDHVAVSPDGTKIAYISSASAADQVEVVYVADIDGSNARAYPTTRSPDAARSPSWSPDGSTIVYQAMGFGSVGDLFLLDVASGDVRRLTDLASVPEDVALMMPTFDPSGDAVLFTLPTRTTPSQSGLWSIPVTGGDPTLIRRNADGVDASPDVQLITFVEVRIVDGQEVVGGLWIADPDGGAGERVVEGPVSLSRWSPDGTRILYADEERDALMILDLDTRETVRMPSAADGSDWLDDRTLIVDATPN